MKNFAILRKQADISKYHIIILLLSISYHPPAKVKYKLNFRLYFTFNIGVQK